MIFKSARKMLDVNNSLTTESPLIKLTNTGQLGMQRDKKWYKSLLDTDETTERDGREGALSRANMSEYFETIVEKEEPEGYDAERITFKTVSTKNSGKRRKSINRREDGHEACCSKKQCNIF